jgi:hypothetical protein
MKRKTAFLEGLLLFALAILLVLGGCERKIVNEIEGDDEGLASTFVGSSTCQACHADIYETFSRSGHPFKLNRIEDVEAGDYYPYTSFPGPAPGYDWSDFSYVIGGFWWKARFIDTEGYVLTGDEVQYNFETQEWVGYHSDEAPGTKPYDCGRCHTTGYSPDGHQDGLEGIIGTWAEPGIQCEECHGRGSKHAENPYSFDMIIDRSSEQCGECHIRGPVNQIPASGGFIKHHEQWNEMATTLHRSLNCVDCHDPHLGLHASNPDRTDAIVMNCEQCHYTIAEDYASSSLPHYSNDVDCIDCHMAYTGKSAVGDTTIHRGDIRSHLWRINTDPNATLTDGSTANGYITLDFSCLTSGCHLSESRNWAASHADDVHP